MPDTTVTRAARALLAHLIDFAGLFPPAGLSMEEAIERYVAFSRGTHGWMLGRFVVPLDYLDRFEADASAALPRGAGAVPWRITVLGSADPAREVMRVQAFNEHHRGAADRGAARIDVVDIKASRVADVERARPFVAAGLSCFCELPMNEELPALVEASRAVGAGVKLRTGGVVPEAFPSPAALARAIMTCAAAGTPMKATAGLHHAVRGPHRLTYDADGVTSVTHGFLNLILAAAFAWDATSRGTEPRGARGEVEHILGLEDPRLLVVDDQRVAWGRAVALPVERLEAARQDFVVAFGSCSFEEPVDELQTLGWI